jgi:hypothetical protein
VAGVTAEVADGATGTTDDIAGADTDIMVAAVVITVAGGTAADVGMVAGMVPGGDGDVRELGEWLSAGKRFRTSEDAGGRRAAWPQNQAAPAGW